MSLVALYVFVQSLHDGDFVVALEPERGCIGARGSVECKITFYPLNEVGSIDFQLHWRLHFNYIELHFTIHRLTRQGIFSDIVIPCQIANSKQFVFLCISAVVKRPQESFEVLVLDEPNQIVKLVLVQLKKFSSFIFIVFFKYMDHCPLRNWFLF